jgi:hypothetical protein
MPRRAGDCVKTDGRDCIQLAERSRAGQLRAVWIRQLKARPAADTLHAWLIAQRQKVPPGSATAKAMDYSLGRWQALVRYIDDGNLPATTTGLRTRSDRLPSAQQLAVCRLAARGQAGRRDHESRALGQAEWA